MVGASITAALPTSAAVTLLGTIASQPHVPAQLTTCHAAVDGGTFAPQIEFLPQANPVARYTVLLAFFDKKNVSVGQVNVTDHGADSYPLPGRADSMTCAIARLTLDDGSTYPVSSAGSASAGGVALGVLGAGAIVGIILATKHSSSTSSATAKPSGSPSPSPSPTGSASVSSSASPTSSVTATPTPSPFPTSIPTAVPTVRPPALRR